jgi:retinol dehydrogenase 12
MLRQAYFIPKPTLTEANLPDQSGRVHLVTGGYGGCGLELSKMLYEKNAIVYLAGRSKEKGTQAIETLKQQYPKSTGRVEFLQLDLADLTTIKKSADDFMSRESRLDVLTNNAGVMVPPLGSKTAQGYELQLGTNCLGPYLFTKLLLPVIQKTAASSPPGSVRVTWAASLTVELFAPKRAVALDDSGAPIDHNDKQKNYGQSKAGNFLLAAELARRYGKGKDGIVSNAWNPGNLRTDLTRHNPKVMTAVANAVFLYPARFGGYTELYAACSPDLTLDNNGAYIFPWGRIGTDQIKPDHLKASKPESEGGYGVATKFWDWCERETRQYQ